MPKSEIMTILTDLTLKLLLNSWGALKSTEQGITNFTELVGIVNATVYKAQPIFTLAWAWQIVLIFSTVTPYGPMVIINPGNGLNPVKHLAIPWTNVD